jgi:Family of unknown function (DUF5677)
MPADERTRHFDPATATVRECGLELLALSTVYERPVVGDEAGVETLAMVGLVARMRRLLRASYRLADAGEVLEASILNRAMMEYLFTLRWLQVDPELHYVLWATADLKARLTIDREVREQAEEQHAEAVELMEPNVRDQYEQALRKMQAQIDEARERLAGRTLRLPSFEQRAREAELPFAYSLAYRYDSITGAHPTPHAIEQLMVQHPRGIAILPEPPPERGYADAYGVAAHVLLDALNSAADKIPELRLGEGLEAVKRRLMDLAPQA